MDELTSIKIIKYGKKKKKVIQSHQHDNYKYCESRLKDLSYYEYISAIHRIRKLRYNDDTDESSRKRISRNIHIDYDP